MPQLGETVAEGTVLRWLKQVGDEVADQEPLLEIATDKVDTEVPSPAGGVLLEITVGADETVGVGTVLARLGAVGRPGGERSDATGADMGHGAPRGSEPERGGTAQAADTEAIGPHSVPPVQRVAAADAERADARDAKAALAKPGADVAVRSAGPRHQHSPRVRRMAQEAGVDLPAVSGSGPGGRVTPDDVTRFARRDTAARARGATAEVQVSHAVPEAPGGSTRLLRTVVATADMSAAWRAASRSVGRPRGAAAEEHLAAVVTAVVASVLRTYPQLTGGQRPAGERFSVAVCQTSGQGARAVVVTGADELNTEGIARRLREGEPSDGAKAGPEPTPTLTLSFTQDDDIVLDIADPAASQVATISVGPPTERVVVVDTDGATGIGIRRTANLALRYDENQLEPNAAVRFLREVAHRLAALSSTP